MGLKKAHKFKGKIFLMHHCIHLSMIDTDVRKRIDQIDEYKLRVLLMPCVIKCEVMLKRGRK